MSSQNSELAHDSVTIFENGLEENLRHPIAEDAPIGKDPRFEAPGVAIYRELRDARSAARNDERKHERGESGAIQSGASPEWRRVRDLALQLTREAAKDVEVLAWLIEAETRLYGYAGLARSFRLVHDLVALFGADLHPRPEEPDDDPYAVMAGLNGVGREGALIQPLRLTPLVPGAPWGQFSLWDSEMAGARDALQQAISIAGVDAMSQRHGEVRAAITALDQLDALLAEKLGGDAPPFAQIREILDDTERTIRRLAGLDDSAGVAEVAGTDVNAAAPQNPATKAPGGPITSREEAFSELLRISAYFRKAEPHSPIGYALETLVRRGRMDFLALIEELIPDDHTRESVMTMAGVRPQRDRESGEDG
ncbi:type VI secretion system protein TssA [Paracoccaceae bacterium GXU_MW_L88]